MVVTWTKSMCMQAAIKARKGQTKLHNYRYIREENFKYHLSCMCVTHIQVIILITHFAIKFKVWLRFSNSLFQKKSALECLCCFDLGPDCLCQDAKSVASRLLKGKTDLTKEEAHQWISKKTYSVQWTSDRITMMCNLRTWFNSNLLTSAFTAHACMVTYLSLFCCSHNCECLVIQFDHDLPYQGYQLLVKDDVEYGKWQHSSHAKTSQ